MSEIKKCKCNQLTSLYFKGLNSGHCCRYRSLHYLRCVTRRDRYTHEALALSAEKLGAPIRTRVELIGTRLYSYLFTVFDFFFGRLARAHF